MHYVIYVADALSAKIMQNRMLDANLLTISIIYSSKIHTVSPARCRLRLAFCYHIVLRIYNFNIYGILSPQGRQEKDREKLLFYSYGIQIAFYLRNYWNAFSANSTFKYFRLDFHVICEFKWNLLLWIIFLRRE